MKILHTVESYDPASNGMQQVVKQLSERLVKLGHDVIVATQFDEKRKSSIINGVKIRQFRISGREATGYHANKNEIEQYRDFVIKGDFDVVANFAAQQWATDLLLPILDQINSVKVFIPTGFSGIYDPRFADYFDRLKSQMKSYDMSVFLSDDYQDINFARNNGIEKTTLIPNGAAMEEFINAPPDNIRKDFNIPQDHFLILNVGSHTGLKGHKEAIEIFKKAKINNATLLIIGNAPHSHNSFKSITKFAVKKAANIVSKLTGKQFFPACSLTCYFSAKYFRFTKAALFQNKKLVITTLQRPDTISAYNNADLFLFPSNIECSPLVLFEAMASKTPFLTTDVGNAKEIISWTAAGELLPTIKIANGYGVADVNKSAEILANVINDKPLLKKMQYNGFNVVNKRFSWQQIAMEYEKLYLRLLSKKTAPDNAGIGV